LPTNKNEERILKRKIDELNKNKKNSDYIFYYENGCIKIKRKTN